jgi:hypothetical protein
MATTSLYPYSAQAEQGLGSLTTQSDYRPIISFNLKAAKLAFVPKAADLIMSEEDAKIFFEACENPPTPTP